jgi:cytochrome c
VIRAAIFALVVATAPCQAAETAAELGQAIVQDLCARCHAVGAAGESALSAAPPFRTLGQRFEISDLQEALAEGIVTAHPDMPEFAFAPEDVAAIIAYLESIQQD